MKTHVIALVEAVRLARTELECFRDADRSTSCESMIARLRELLESEDVTEALAFIAPGNESPSIVPEPPVNLKVPYPWRSH